MARLFKTLADLLPEDIQTLCRDQQPEDERLEFKEYVPGKTGRDSWHDNQESVGDYGRNKILAEVIAFANSYGGDVIIGIRETDDKPHRAAAINPVPLCVELAHRLELQASSCIEPPIPQLQVRGVPVSEDGSGVVILRTPRSRVSPHRLIPNKECYQRVRDRTETMTMRQIQDLTFAVARGLDAVDARLKELWEANESFVDLQSVRGTDKRFGYTIVAVPATNDCYLQQVHGVAVVRPLTTPRAAQLNGKEIKLSGIVDIYDWRPTLRGTRADHSRGGGAERVGLFNDGAIIYSWYRHTPGAEAAPDPRAHILYPLWLFCDVMNALDSIERVRIQAGAIATEYAMKVAVFCTPELPSLSLNTRWQEVAGTFPRGTTEFPRYAIGPVEEFDDVATRVWHDYWNAIGVDAQNDRLSLRQPHAVPE